MPKHYVIIGAGQAGRRMAESLREHDTAAQISLVGAEPELPYDRPALSKDGLLSEQALSEAFVVPAQFYTEQRIDVYVNTEATSIDPTQRQVHLSDGRILSYDDLILCTGSRVRHLDLPGAQSAPLHYIRTMEDCRALRSAATHKKNVVIIGGGFIGLEVAATLKAHFDCQVTVLENGSRILQRTMPAPVSQFVHELHESKGVQIHLNTHIESLEQRDAHTTAVLTNHGIFEADLIVVGIGVHPNQELAAAAGVKVNNGIVVDAQGRTSVPHIYASGDVTAHTNPYYDKPVRLESWQVAEHHPAVIAEHLHALPSSYQELPWLWSDQYDCSMQMLGDFNYANSIHRRQEADPNRFAWIGLDAEQRLKAVCTVNQGRDMSLYKRLMSSAKPISAELITDSSQSLRDLQKALV